MSCLDPDQDKTDKSQDHKLNICHISGKIPGKSHNTLAIDTVRDWLCTLSLSRNINTMSPLQRRSLCRAAQQRSRTYSMFLPGARTRALSGMTKLEEHGARTYDIAKVTGFCWASMARTPASASCPAWRASSPAWTASLGSRRSTWPAPASSLGSTWPAPATPTFSLQVRS